MQIIRKNGKKMFARYSNIIGIRLGQTKQSNIILYCLDRTIIPFGEHSLPESIAGKPCDLIENFIILGKCPSYCSEEIPEYGCSIGIPSKQGAGSVGFFYETDNSKFGSGFITAAHVAIESCYESRYQNRLLSNCSLRRQGQRITHSIVHPKCRNDEGNEHIVGQVVESFYGEYKLSSTLTEGLDFAAVKTNCCRHGSKFIYCILDPFFKVQKTLYQSNIKMLCKLISSYKLLHFQKQVALRHCQLNIIPVMFTCQKASLFAI